MEYTTNQSESSEDDVVFIKSTERPHTPDNLTNHRRRSSLSRTKIYEIYDEIGKQKYNNYLKRCKQEHIRGKHTSKLWKKLNKEIIEVNEEEEEGKEGNEGILKGDKADIKKVKRDMDKKYPMYSPTPTKMNFQSYCKREKIKVIKTIK